MPAERVMLQVGPVLPLPMGVHRTGGCWYIYLRSISPDGTIHESGPESTTVYRTQSEATTRMALIAHRERVPWRLTRDRQDNRVPILVAYYRTSRDAVLRRPCVTDRIERAAWAKPADFELELEPEEGQPQP